MSQKVGREGKARQSETLPAFAFVRVHDQRVRQGLQTGFRPADSRAGKTAVKEERRMELALIVLRQTVVMFLYMLVGFALFKTGKITKQGSRELATLLLWLVIPTVLINSFCVSFSAEKLRQLMTSSLLGALALLAAMVVSRVLFPKAPIDDFASAFSNAGFMGIPLVQASLGAEAVFYVAGMIALLNILQWTYGVGILTGKKSAVTVKSVFCNPIMGGVLIGLALFLTGLGTRLPSVVGITLQGLAALNAPLAMLILGCYLAQTDLKKMVTSPRLYWVSAVRLVVIPLLTLLAFLPLPVTPQMKLAVFITAAAPVGANVAVYAQLHDLDYPYACQTVSLSTVLCMASMPLLLLLANTIFL